MRGWIDREGEYFESPDNISHSPNIAIEVLIGDMKKIEEESQIRKEMQRLLREQAIVSLEAKEEI